MVYVDASRPDLVDGFTRKTFTAMIEGIREPAIAAGLIEPERFDAGVRALYRTTEPDGVFCYTFFKGVGERRDASRHYGTGTWRSRKVNVLGHPAALANVIRQARSADGAGRASAVRVIRAWSASGAPGRWGLGGGLADDPFASVHVHSAEGRSRAGV